MSNEVINEIETCPTSPNCVSSLTSSKKHVMEPWSYIGEKEAVMSMLKTLVLKMGRVRLEESSENHFHFIFTTKLMRFKDDVWFFFDDEKKLIQFKSASRTGHSDWGVNKERMNLIKSKLF